MTTSAVRSAPRFVVYSGPSCVGKSPLRAVLERYFPQYRPANEGGEAGRPILFVSRAPRKGEYEGHPYRFRTVKEIEAMVAADPARYITGWIRDNEQLQALDLEETRGILEKHKIILLEIYHTLGSQVLEPGHLARLSAAVDALPVFISPLSQDEIRCLRGKGADLPETVTGIMRRKLDRRATEPTEKREVRARFAHEELRNAHKYAHVIVNHDGEDSDNWGLPLREGYGWSLPYPIGDAKRTLETFVEILETGDSSSTEHWQPDTI